MENPPASVSSTLDSLVNHIALPPRLPGKRENDIPQIERKLTDRLLNAARTLRQLTDSEISSQWEGVRHLLQNCKNANEGGKLNKTSLLAHFRRLEREESIILHVAEQNAGLLIRRHHENQRDLVIFEAFEAAPLSENVLAAESALQWDFPGCAVAIPYSEFSNESFQDNLASLLEQASTELIQRFAAHTNKAGTLTLESRDTVDPSLITQMLMTLLEVNGDPMNPPRFRKRIRDEVYWAPGAVQPWRRSAYWLVLRVGLQQHLYTHYGDEAGRALYKLLLCVVLVQLLADCLEHLSPEVLVFLKAKLSRRIAKLEITKERASPNVYTLYEIMLVSLRPLFMTTIEKADERVQVLWNKFKQALQKGSQRLPRYANQRHLELSLPNSGPYLQQVLSLGSISSTSFQPSTMYRPPSKFDISRAATNNFTALANQCFSLSKQEAEIAEYCSPASALMADNENRCTKLAKMIDSYTDVAADFYRSNPEENSVMLLSVLEIWMLMDQCAIQLFDLLKDYSPGIPPEILDVLQLPYFPDMLRLQRIQQYLQERHEKSGFSFKTIFDDPTKGCFAERYFNESKTSASLQELHHAIEASAELARTRKEEEWRDLSAEFEELQTQIARGTCLFTTSDTGVVYHDDRGCTKCYLQRQARRMKIQRYEHPLPSNDVQAKAVVFELACPRAFAAYRDATWRVLGTLARPQQLEYFSPKLELCEYSQLREFMKSPPGSVSLASTTKSFLSTHYNMVGFPVDLTQVFRPNGLKLAYFDNLSKSWPGRKTTGPTFSHHCPMNIPLESPLSSLQLTSNRPSSYQVIASQVDCPSGLNVHEFMAYQSLLSGSNRQWSSILVELGSSNLNFSNEAVTLLMNRLAWQAGPRHNTDPFRIAHIVFRDESFCRRLIEQICQRLDVISSNWRETNCMEMLLTLILRLCSLAPKPVVQEAFKLLETAREATFKWTKQLRMEIHQAMDTSTSDKCSKYAFRAALLCKRTFTIYREDFGSGDEEYLQPGALHCFIACSITLQDFSINNPATLQILSKNALIRDLKMVYRMRNILRRSVEAHPDSLNYAINDIWPQPEGALPRSSSNLRFLGAPHEWWVQLSTKATQATLTQTLHYHLLEGHLLVDGQSLGKLPAEFRESITLKQLFGDRSLFMYPSGVRGMRYSLAFPVKGHQINLGFRNQSLVVQAYFRGTILELIPSEIFGNASSFDLPTSLVENCVHWLDLQTGVMEIRQRPYIWKSNLRNWKSKRSNWELNLNKREARRNQGSSLVDPHSPLFRNVARLFEGFEYPDRLTVFQPQNGKLSVELRRLELSFFVNQNNLLECRQLGAEIDPDQDAGTWYGLNGKIVLRDARNKTQRSIIVPMGSLRYTRNAFHVTVQVENTGSYGRYTINKILGRLDCPPEPRLLYLKAQLHAYTSFIVPDPLTRRTGTEEALHCLKSGYCQPWTPLRGGSLESLKSLAELTPKREYYPKDLKRMQQVFWDPNLSTTIQHEEFKPIVEAIYETSKQLSAFAPGREGTSSLEPPWRSPHLLRRASLRRQLYQRLHTDSDEQPAASDLLYQARDRCVACQARINVHESVSLIRDWLSKIRTTADLAGILQNWPTIGGYDRVYDKFLLSGLLNIELAPEWGALINFCRASTRHDKYKLMTMFAAMSFRGDVDMDIVRTLIAFAVFEDLKAPEPPQWPCYKGFRQNQIPNAHYLAQLIKPYCHQYPGDERDSFHVSSKRRRQLEAAQRAHEQQVESDVQNLARFLLEQWPCSIPSFDGFSSQVLFDVSVVMRRIVPDWLQLFQNFELSNYIRQIQHVLDRHWTGRAIKEPRTSHLEEQEVLTGGRVHVELPRLPRDLVRKSCPHPNTHHNGTILGQGAPSNVSYASSTGSGVNNLMERSSNVTGKDVIHVSGGHHDKYVSTLQKENVTSGLQKSGQTHRTLPSVSHETKELTAIVGSIIKSDSAVREEYGRGLMQSLDAFQNVGMGPKQDTPSLPLAHLSAQISEAERVVQKHFVQLCTAFESNNSSAQWLKKGGLWPCVTPVTLLELLRSTLKSTFGNSMKESLVAYGVAITTLQRLLRIDDALQKRKQQTLHDEQNNAGHSNWWPLQYPDWLLLEIESNILIRRDQVDVALATISPASRSNSVLQMNMGQGKTSCVMPMAAAVLADTKQLVRVVVPKALLLQTAQLLQARLGGLVGRRLCHVPFSRKTSTNLESIKGFFDIHRNIKASSGLVVALPEHILSFKLSGLQRLSDGRLPEASKMINVEAWFQKYSRDVLDECDFILSPRTQLIYPSGDQKTVDGHPHRWQTAEVLLHLVENHLWNLRQDFPESIEILERSQGGFPVVYFLRKDVEDALILRLVRDILRGQTSIVPIKECTQSDRLMIKQFISEAKVRPAVVERIRQLFQDKPAVKQNIYLLRGLLVHRILLLTLKKRWNVQYGLHPDRDPIAVPFHAKGVPSAQSEWGHVDVSILFTCLAFYYEGLNPGQLRQALEHVVKSDDPASEFDRWTHSSKTLPGSLRDWNTINVDDETQLAELRQHFRYSVVAIDYFLNNFVFPRHAKQFRTKLQASGWDIPLFVPGSQSHTGQKACITTGFSGTNDNRTMMPLTIKQDDLRRLVHTNAEVLTYLLQPRNGSYEVAVDARGRRLSEKDLLEMLSNKKIRMLIDAGAQILEMDNRSLAAEWLKKDTQAPAAVYFDVANKPIVLYRHGSETPLVASPFAENLGECLVYLDEAHTRGTDLKMPTYAVGALTLGLGQTKDHTVQAAMRLRQLATTQRVIFFSPPEVHQSITDLCGKKIIKSSDVIRWLLEQSCSGIEQMQPLYFSQGVDFCRRTQGALDNSNFLTQGDQRDAYLDILRQNEQQTLVQLYRPSRPKPTKALGPFAPQIVPLMNELDHRRKGFQDRGDAVHASTLQEVEQEREVAYEVEAIREVQKPVRQSPYSFRGLHKDIMNFVKTGNLAAGDGGYEHAFVALRHTALGQKYNIKSEVIKSKFYLSKEFSRTVLPLGSPNDNFLRQVNWILWSVIAETALVLIPEEAEEVIPLLREADRSPTHLLTYAAPVTRKMLHFNDLNYYALPALPTGWKPPTWLAIELAIFAGRLYFNYDEYADLCTYLGIQEDGTKFLDTSEDTALGTDVAGEDGDTANTESKIMDMSTTRESTRSPTFTAKPLTFLQEWLAIRRKGQDFTHTPMGYLCQGKPLKPTHPFFAAPEHEAATAPTTNTIGTTFSGQASRVEAADSETGEFDEEIEDGGDDGYFYDEGRDDGQEEEDEYAMYDEDGDPVE